MIIVFGSLNIDMVMPVGHFPAPGETVLCSADYLSRTGGKGANQAVAAARAGAKVAMVGRVGDDAFGRRSMQNLKNQSIWTSGIGIAERPTGCSTIAVDAEGHNIVITAPGANLDVTADQVPDEILIPKNLLLVQLEAAPAETALVLARARALGCPTILNASPASRLARESFAGAGTIIVNEVESRQAAAALGASAEDPAARARGIAAAAKADCIITLEERGCLLAREGRLWAQAALDVDVVDSTGAGDAFCGIYAALLQASRPFAEALHCASVGASLSCLGLGAQAGMPFIDDIETARKTVPPPREV